MISEVDIRDMKEIETAVSYLTKTCYKASDEAGWWKPEQATNPFLVSNKLMLIVSEVAEAMEADRKGSKDDKLPHRSGVEVELADALIRICDLAGYLRMDLGGAVAEKMAYNKQRADHKPEVRAATGGKKY